jgi:hypothetical protein
MAQPKLETLAQRLVYSPDGTRWRVREALAHDIPGAEADSCLIFDGGQICRRFWNFPEGWTELPDVSLLAFMDRVR